MTMLDQLIHEKLSTEEYESRLPELQLRLMHFQQAIYKSNRRVIFVVEGTDAAGKGGMIKRLVELMDPRGVRVYPIGAPSPNEISTHYMKRFWQRIPHHGEIAIFDRSWYGRVLVERVEKITKKSVWKRAYGEINDFEKLLMDDGVILVKLFLKIDLNEQRKRFLSRLKNPEKAWKITPADIESRKYWDAYLEAFEDMFAATHTPEAAWHIVPANCKKFARVSCLEHACEKLEEAIDLDRVQLIDPDFKSFAISELEKG